MMGLILAILLAFSAPVERCAEETGETQQVCVWSDGTGVPVLNVDRGRYWIELR